MLVERTLEEVKKIYPAYDGMLNVQQCLKLDDYTCSIPLKNDVHALVDFELWDKILKHYRWFSLKIDILENIELSKPIYEMCQYVDDNLDNQIKYGRIITTAATQIIAYAIGLPYSFPVHHWKQDTKNVEYKLRTANIMIDNRVCNLYVDTILDPDTLHEDSSIDDDNVVWVRGDEIGQFKTREEAEKAHDKAAIDAYGWFAEPYHKNTIIPEPPIFYNPDNLPI